MKLGGFPGKGISFLSGGFPKEVLLERKNRLAKLTADLKKEQAELSVFQQQLTYSDEKIATIEDFCTNIRERLDTLTFDGKRRIPEMLDVLGTLAIENDEKVVYIKCLLGQQLLSVARILHLSSTGNRQQIYILMTRLVLRNVRASPGRPSRQPFFANVLFSGVELTALNDQQSEYAVTTW